jgi:undecaprenyl-diphosphatase
MDLRPLTLWSSSAWPDRIAAVTSELSTIDRAVYEAVARQHTPSLDNGLRRLSLAANRSVLWFGFAGVLTALGGRSGRRAAVNGLVSIGAVSTISGLLKMSRRQRPDRLQVTAWHERYVKMPHSYSFPSGHSASAFAFASAVSSVLPGLAIPTRAVAVAVAYSRVHTGVHYPGDTIAGALLGAATGQVVGWVADSGRRAVAASHGTLVANPS